VQHRIVVKAHVANLLVRNSDMHFLEKQFDGLRIRVGWKKLFDYEGVQLSHRGMDGKVHFEEILVVFVPADVKLQVLPSFRLGHLLDSVILKTLLELILRLERLSVCLPRLVTYLRLSAYDLYGLCYVVANLVAASLQAETLRCHRLFCLVRVATTDMCSWHFFLRSRQTG
jgi:hypothetical protein